MADTLSASFAALSLRPFPSSFTGAQLWMKKPPALCLRPLKGVRLRVARAAAAPAALAASPADTLEAFVKAALPGGFAAQHLLGTGRRKCAIARVALVEGTGKIIINGRTAQDYLQGNPLWLHSVKFPLVSLGYEYKYDTIVKAHGGGLSAQAQAILLGISRALVVANQANRDPLKKQGLLTRDPRRVERKKYGLKKARKAPQYSKR
ncbi:hypothetical protein O6H91_16G055000 [Diphasiastrum complanatum]|uniref:Uncharacterized protein n=1 Tax=Diphasiastrum complanatum TaxID=34168 RepID=A0ACC2BCM0_DIPCM|nr:hypothetical protein O6H91_16G055000 [Diphasiastrum complanatum]